MDLSAPAALVAGDPSLVAQSPGAVGHGQLRFMALAEYARNPLALISPRQSREEVVESQGWLHAGASLALWHRWLAAVDVPLLLLQTGQNPAFDARLPPASGSVSLGDPRLTLRGRVLGEANAFALGVGVAVTVPLATGAYAGGAGATLAPFVSAGHEDRSGFSAFQLGFSLRKAQTLPGILPTRIGSSLDLGIGAGVVLDRAGTTRLGPELSARFITANGARVFDPRSTTCLFLLHLQHRVAGGPLVVGAAVGPGLGLSPGAADYRALLSLSFSPDVPAPPPDGDRDTVPDSSDMCPSLPGEPSNDPLMHGCPLAPPDADGDAIPDSMDACPRTPGVPDVTRAQHGCPPMVDRDRDRVADADDACPDQPGSRSDDPAQNGCPKPAPAATLQESSISISEQVQFETGTAQLRPESEAILREVLQVLQEHRELELVEVAGHTDDTGGAALNERLSRERAASVLEWLVAHGAERSRLTYRGYGATRPLGDNATPEGRTKNRRVELVILRRAVREPQQP